jgi:ketosteroid isomerase-like protein
MLSDGDRIRSVLGQYCERIDAGDFEGVGALFARGVLADEHGTELARGAEAVAAFFAATERLHDGSPRTKHLILNTAFDEEGDTVVARSSYLVLQAVKGFPLQPIITGRYIDRFERDGVGWHFAERRFIVDLTGDVSHHLVRPKLERRP